ncbi:MAG TPA: ATP-binding cassette domain-containing protein [Gemmatimonadales bacterium]|jgi:ABC-type polar amino acid transport system ATPase subunit|nr:ATP-binding cassette domain-containing protein [Gemmatimonadales bacterium]
MTALLVIDRLCVRYDGREVLRALSLEVSRGEFVALMGPSGVGKTTALRAVAALQPFDEGHVLVEGFALSPGPVPPESHLVPLRRSVGFVFQAHALFEHLSALDNVTLALRHVLGKGRTEADAIATTLLAELDVGPRAGAWPRQLSGGEAQRVAIARALAPDPALLLMDEPTAALDPARRSALGATLRQLCGRGRGLLVSTHDAEFARAHADRLVILTA